METAIPCSLCYSLWEAPVSGVGDGYPPAQGVGMQQDQLRGGGCRGEGLRPPCSQERPQGLRLEGRAKGSHELRWLLENYPGKGQSHSEGTEPFAKHSEMGCLERAWALQLPRLRLKYQHSWLPRASVSPCLEDVLGDSNLTEWSPGIVTLGICPLPGVCIGGGVQLRRAPFPPPPPCLILPR